MSAPHRGCTRLRGEGTAGARRVERTDLTSVAPSCCRGRSRGAANPCEHMLAPKS